MHHCRTLVHLHGRGVFSLARGQGNTSAIIVSNFLPTRTELINLDSGEILS